MKASEGITRVNEADDAIVRLYEGVYDMVWHDEERELPKGHEEQYQEIIEYLEEARGALSNAEELFASLRNEGA